MGYKTIVFFLLFFALNFPGKAQNSLDSLQQAVQNMPEDTSKIKALIDIGKKYQYKNADSSHYFLQQAVNLADAVNSPEWLTSAYLGMGVFFHQRGNYKKAKDWKNSALNTAKKYQLSKRYADIHNQLAPSFRRLGQMDSAFYHYTVAEKEYIRLGKHYDSFTPNLGLGRLFLDKNDYENAEIYLKKAWAIVEKGDNRADTGFVLFYLGNLYFFAEDFEQFSIYSQKWDEFNQQADKKFMGADDMFHVGALTLFFREDTRTTEKLKLAVEYQKSNGNNLRAGNWSKHLGILQQEKGEYKTALNSFSESEKYLSGTDAEVNKMEIFSLLYEINKKTGDVPKAFHYLEKFHTLSDSLRKEDILKNFDDLQVKYETEKKEQEIKLQALEIKQKTTQNNLLLAGSILLALLALAIYFNYRNRIRTNQKLAAQQAEIQNQKIQQLEQEKKLLSLSAMIEGQEQERMRIANDLHDSLGGLLTSVKAHFNTLKAPVSNGSTFTKTNHLIDEACVEVRRISHNMMPRALALSGLKGALEDLAGDIERQGIKCDLEILGLGEIPQTKSVMIYRLIQELCNNIIKHAEAKNILLQLLQNKNELTIIVEDDGKGFDVQQALKKKGLGLSSVESRVKFLQGEIDWDSVLGEGTTVSIKVDV